MDAIRCMRIKIGIVGVTVLCTACADREMPEYTLIRSSRAVDGRGNQVMAPAILIHGGEIVEMRPETVCKARVLDLTPYTILPGLIDTHVHITAHFAAELYDRSIMDIAADNAENLLMSGFTTVRSLGWSTELETSLRNAIKEKRVRGPRIVVSGDVITDETLPGAEGDVVKLGGSPAGEEELRTFVDRQKSASVDWIKVFASRSSRQGGSEVYSQQQLEWVASEARRVGLPVAAHAHSSEAARRAIHSGARSIEHGGLLDDDVLDLMVGKPVYFMPNLYLSEYYLGHAKQFGYSAEELDWTRRLIPIRTRVFTNAVRRGVRIAFATDAAAGWISSGTTALEFDRRVRSGQSPKAAVASATSTAAEALMLENQLGDLRPGLVADLIAVDGNPLEDIGALGRVVFVMKAGEVYKHPWQGPLQQKVRRLSEADPGACGR